MLTALVLNTNVPALLFSGDRLLGETAKSRRVTLPVDDAGRHYIWALPLEGGYSVCAAAAELAPEPGIQGSAQLIDWGGAYSVTLCLPKAYAQTERLPGALAKKTLQGGSIATLYVSEAGGVHLAIEKEDEVLLSKAISRERAGMEYERFPDGELLFITAPDKCVAVQNSSSCTVTCELPGSVFTRSGRQITAIQPLPGTLGLERSTALDGLTGARQASKVGFFTHPAKRPATPQEAAAALLETLRYRCDGEAAKLLSGELAGADAESLRAFFGEYSRIEPPPAMPGGAYMGVLPDGICVRGRIFRFDAAKEDGMWKITGAEACGEH